MSESWQALKAKGNSEYTSGNTDAAIEAYTAALKDTEIPANDKATILCNRAQCWLKLGDNKKAAEDCTSCLTIAPDNMKALFRRAAAFEALDQKKDALKDYREVLRINPSVSDAIAAVRRLEVALGEAPSQPAKGSRKGQQQGGGLTEEDAKQLEETKTRVKEVALQKIKAKDAQQTAAKEKRQLELTLSQVQALPATSATYKPVGRAFIATPKTEMVTSLNEKMAKCEQKLKVCATALEHIEKQEKEADAHFLEVVNSVRSRMQA